MRVLHWMFYERSAHGVFKDVARERFRVIVRAHDPIEVPLLPKSLVNPQRKCRSRSLFRRLREAAKIRLFGLAFNQEVRVIGHEAVRKD